MAEGDPSPAWPMPSVSPKFATWSVGGGRPFGCEGDACERWHAGIDLTGAPEGAEVVAPEDAEVVAVDRGWSGAAKAIFLRTKSGLFLVLGGLQMGSPGKYGITAGKSVRKGDRLGRVLGAYGMIHLETYAAEDRRANSVWWKDEPPPDGLLNPTNYVERMVGDRVSLVRSIQRHEAL
ncbi:MAG: M23 family metallopeptidase, partial [Myxococcales bacterium]|nr:M23 family metallopeptidase [Myxococcales bacterium]